MIDCDAPFSLEHAFHEVDDGYHTLRNELAPTGESDVRTFLDQITEYSVPRFDLSIKYAQEGDTPQELVKVSYSPSSSFAPVATPAAGVLEFGADREKLNLLYRRAQDGGY
jgi:hypothetical protein